MIENVKIALIDPNEVFIEGFVQLIQSTNGMEVSSYSASAKRVFDSFSIQKPDLVIACLTSSDWDVIHLMRKLKESYPDVKLVICERSDPGPLLMLLLKAGVSSYLLKDTLDRPELVRIVHAVVRNRFACSHLVSVELIEAIESEQSPDPEIQLSKRERDILIMTCDGLSRREIAQKLFLTEATIKFHLDKLRCRFDCQNIIQLVVKSMRQGIVSL